MCWSPNGEALCIWCSNSGESKLLIYSTISESHIGIFCPKDQTQQEKENFVQKELRGIEMVKWMPNSQLLAIAGHNEVVIFYMLFDTLFLGIENCRLRSYDIFTL